MEANVSAKGNENEAVIEENKVRRTLSLAVEVMKRQDEVVRESKKVLAELENIQKEIEEDKKDRLRMDTSEETEGTRLKLQKAISQLICNNDDIAETSNKLASSVVEGMHLRWNDSDLTTSEKIKGRSGDVKWACKPLGKASRSSRKIMLTAGQVLEGCSQYVNEMTEA